MVCSECWNHTLPVDAYQTCPLKLLADRTLGPEQTPACPECSRRAGLFYLLFQTPKDKQKQVVKEWIEAGWKRWVEHWNTVPDEAEREAVTKWRHLILQTVWQPSEEGNDPTTKKTTAQNGL